MLNANWLITRTNEYIYRTHNNKVTERDSEYNNGCIIKTWYSLTHVIRLIRVMRWHLSTVVRYLIHICIFSCFLDVEVIWFSLYLTYIQRYIYIYKPHQHTSVYPSHIRLSHPRHTYTLAQRYNGSYLVIHRYLDQQPRPSLWMPRQTSLRLKISMAGMKNGPNINPAIQTLR